MTLLVSRTDRSLRDTIAMSLADSTAEYRRGVRQLIPILLSRPRVDERVYIVPRTKRSLASPRLGLARWRYDQPLEPIGVSNDIPDSCCRHPSSEGGSAIIPVITALLLMWSYPTLPSSIPSPGLAHPLKTRFAFTSHVPRQIPIAQPPLRSYSLLIIASISHLQLPRHGSPYGSAHAPGAPGFTLGSALRLLAAGRAFQCHHS